MTDLTDNQHSAKTNPPIWLASGSAQRLELLRQVGIEPIIIPVDLDESVRPGETADDYVHRLAVAKASAGQRLITDAQQGQAHHHRASVEQALVIGADTTIELDGQILTKPESEEAAIEMLLQLSCRDHTVLTGTAIVSGPGTVSAVVSTRVSFGTINLEDARWYVATGEPMNKAGSYGIQGLGARFVASLEGSYSNVVGLPLYELMQLLRESGFDPNLIHV